MSGDSGKRLDELDLKILAELVRDGRASLRKVAERVGASVSTVAARVEAMERSGVIKGYAAVVDPQKLGYEITAIIHVRIKEGRLLEVQKEVAENPNVFGVYDVTGEADSIILARFKDRRELSRFIKRLLAHEYVERTITHIALDTIKEDFRPPIEARRREPT